nr:hypothetical protein K-LCC10_0023 [Kaumoebavirus]
MKTLTPAKVTPTRYPLRTAMLELESHLREMRGKIGVDYLIPYTRFLYTLLRNGWILKDIPAVRTLAFATANAIKHGGKKIFIEFMPTFNKILKGYKHEVQFEFTP